MLIWQNQWRKPPRHELTVMEHLPFTTNPVEFLWHIYSYTFGELFKRLHASSHFWVPLTQCVSSCLEVECSQNSSPCFLGSFHSPQPGEKQFERLPWNPLQSNSVLIVILLIYSARKVKWAALQRAVWQRSCQKKRNLSGGGGDFCWTLDPMERGKPWKLDKIQWQNKPIRWENKQDRCLKQQSLQHFLYPHTKNYWLQSRKGDLQIFSQLPCKKLRKEFWNCVQGE